MSTDIQATPTWLKILKFAPVRLALLGTPLFFCLGFSNALMDESKGH